MNKGERLRNLREKAGLSQVDAAEKIGVSKQTLYKYEKNIISNIPSDVIERIAIVYNTSPAFIFGWEERAKQIGEELMKQAKSLTDFFETHTFSESVDGLYAKYDPSEVERGLKFIKAFLNATPERQKIVLEILGANQSDS